MKFLLPVIIFFGVSCQKHHLATELSPHIVRLDKIHTPTTPPKVTLLGMAKKQSEKDYHIEVPLPKGISIVEKINDEIRVKLPIIHNRFVTGTLIHKDSKQVTILLKNQVQELNAQKIEVPLTLENSQLHIVPFTSVSSPRGVKEKIFVVSGNRAREIEVKVLAPMDSDKVLVHANIQDTDLVVTNGLNNLIDNDLIEEEKNL